MKFLLPIIAAATLVSAGSLAVASECTSAPQDQWKPQAEIEASAKAAGYQVRSVEADDGCYEVYAIGTDGKRSELTYDPMTGDLLETDHDEG